MLTAGWAVQRRPITHIFSLHLWMWRGATACQARRGPVGRQTCCFFVVFFFSGKAIFLSVTAISPCNSQRENPGSWVFFRANAGRQCWLRGTAWNAVQIKHGGLRGWRKDCCSLTFLHVALQPWEIERNYRADFAVSRSRCSYVSTTLIWANKHRVIPYTVFIEYILMLGSYSETTKYWRSFRSS